MELPSERYFPLRMFALRMWVWVSTGDQEKREVPNGSVSNEMQSKEKGEWEMLEISKVDAKPGHLLKSV